MPRRATSTAVEEEGTPVSEQVIDEGENAVEEASPTEDAAVTEDTQQPLPPTPTFFGYAGQVVGAFARAQAEIGVLTKNAKNTFFKTPAGKPAGYVDLAAIAANVPPVLAKHGLAYIQRMEFEPDGSRTIVSYVQHEDGSRLPESRYPVISKDQNDPQKFGGGVTYARRYSIMLYLGLAAEDDDGNTAAQAPRQNSVTPPPSAASRLGAALDKAGFTTKELRQEARTKRFGKVDSLSPAQMLEWAEELEAQDSPSF